MSFYAVSEGRVWRIFERCAVRHAVLLRHPGDDPYQPKGTVTAIKADISLRITIMGMVTMIIRLTIPMITLQRLHLKAQSRPSDQSHNVRGSVADLN